MFDPSYSPLAHADTSRDVLPRGGTSQWRPTRFNLYDPEMRNPRRFNVWPRVYFSGSENVTEFLESIDNQIKLLEIPSDFSCAYLKGHFLRRALDWYQIFGSALVQNTATDFTQLKAALSKAFPAIQNRKDLETRFYASQQRQNQEPTDFACDLLKTLKKLELGTSEKALVDHIFVRLEPRVQDHVEVRNPQNSVHLLEVLAKFEERYSDKAIRGSRNSDNVEGRGWNEATRGLLATDHVILNHGQVTWTTPELAPPLLTTTPHQREDVSALDRFNVHRCPTRRVFSGTGIELMTCLPWLDTLTTGLPQPCPMLVIIEEIGEILKWCVDRIMVEMIIGVTMRIAVKEISGSRAGIGFKIIEIEVKMTILVEGTKEIGVRVKILVEAIEDKWDG
ncbi:uncharacterized protein TNCV_1277091 [Trichonephila clavipes]|nr:uncharacterized protein TNCV_1277091 [Trichonephila clavipes]